MSRARRTPGICAIATVVAGIGLGCGPHRGPTGDAERPPAAREATIFTDSTLYKQVCAEADSGITRASGRCTPRDQSVRPRLTPPPPRRP